MANLFTAIAQGIPGFAQGLQMGEGMKSRATELAQKKELFDLQKKKLDVEMKEQELKQRSAEAFAQEMLKRATTTPTEFNPGMGNEGGGVTRGGPDPQALLLHGLRAGYVKDMDPNRLMRAIQGGGGAQAPTPAPGMRLMRNFDESGSVTGFRESPEPQESGQWEVRQRLDGSLVRVHKATGEMQPVADTLKTAQPYTPEIAALRAVQAPSNPFHQPEFSAWEPGQVPSPEHQDAAMQNARVSIPGQRAEHMEGGKIGARADRLPALTDISRAEAEGQTLGGYSGSGREARVGTAAALEQEKIDIKTSPPNVAAEAKRAREIRKETTIGAAEGEVAPEVPLSVRDLMLFGKPIGTRYGDLAGQVPATPQMREEITQLDNAGAIIDTLAGLADRLITATDALSAAKQFVMLTGGALTKADPAAASYEDTKQSFLGVLSRTLGGERGVLTDRDILRVQRSLPGFRDTVQIKDFKVGAMRRIFNIAVDAKARVVTGAPKNPHFRRDLDRLLADLESPPTPTPPPPGGAPAPRERPTPSMQSGSTERVSRGAAPPADRPRILSIKPVK